MKKILLSAVLASAALAVSAQELTENDLNEIRSSFVRDPQTIALQNILTNEANLKKLALNRALQGRTDHYFKYRVAVKGITDQKQSGRCWMFTSMNVLRASVWPISTSRTTSAISGTSSRRATFFWRTSLRRPTGR